MGKRRRGRRSNRVFFKKKIVEEYELASVVGVCEILRCLNLKKGEVCMGRCTLLGK